VVITNSFLLKIVIFEDKCKVTIIIDSCDFIVKSNVFLVV